MLKPALYDLVEAAHFKDGMYFAERGALDAPRRLWLNTGTHGQEMAGPLAALAELLQKDWKWPNVQMVATLSDPYGYQEEGYGFASIEGEESCWPPLWGYRMDGKGYWSYYDRNSLWGNTDPATLPLSHRAERVAMDTFGPTFTLSLHETVRSEVERDPFWAGAGLLVIETWPISAAEISAARPGAISPSAAIYGLLQEWIGSILGQPRYIHAARALRNNPHYQAVSEIVLRYEQSGYRITGKKWMKYLAMSMRDDIFVGPGRILHGPAMAQAEWHTITDYALSHFGCPGITTETFPTGTALRGIEGRVAQQLAFVEATLDILDRSAI